MHARLGFRAACAHDDVGEPAGRDHRDRRVGIGARLGPAPDGESGVGIAALIVLVGRDSPKVRRVESRTAKSDGAGHGRQFAREAPRGNLLATGRILATPQR